MGHARRREEVGSTSPQREMRRLDPLRRVLWFVAAHWFRIPASLALAGVTWGFLNGEAAGIIPDERCAVVYDALIALLAVGAVLPRVAGVGMGILAVVSTVLCHDYPLSPFAVTDLLPWMPAWLIGLLGYAAGPTLAAPSCAAVCVAIIFPRRMFLTRTLWIPDAYCVLTCILACVVGCVLRANVRMRGRQVQENELLRLRMDADQLDHLRRNVRLQQVIHDLVAGELSYIVLATRGTGGGFLDGERLVAVHDHAVAALAHTRQAIELLRHHDGGSVDGGDGTDGRNSPKDGMVRTGAASPSASDDDQLKIPPTSTDHDMPVSGDDADNVVPESLCAVAERSDADLERLGFVGHSTVTANDGARRCPDRAVEVAADLLHEAYANIVAHGRPDGGRYEAAIRITYDEILIRVENEIGGAADDATGRLMHSGTGLTRQRNAVRACGGSLDTFTDHGVFSLFCEIPLYAQM